MRLSSVRRRGEVVVDPFTLAYSTGVATLVAAELYAVGRRRPGDTITEKVKASTPLHAVMVSLLTWSLAHFTVDPQGYDRNVGVAVGGMAVGWAVAQRRSQRP